MTARIDREDAYASLDGVIALKNGRVGFFGWMWSSIEGECRVSFRLGDQPAPLEALFAVERPDVVAQLQLRDAAQEGLTTFFAICRCGSVTPDQIGSVVVECGTGEADSFSVTRVLDPDASRLVGVLEKLGDGWDHPVLTQLLTERDGALAGALIPRLAESNRLAAAERLGGGLLAKLPPDAPAARAVFGGLAGAYLLTLSRTEVVYIDAGFRARLAEIADLGVARRWLGAGDATKLLHAFWRLGMKPEAMKAAHVLLAMARGDREKLLRGLYYVLPADCRDLLARVLTDPQTTSQDAYGVFNALGGGFAAANRSYEAEMMFAAAAAVHESNDLAHLNTGWMAVARNDVDLALNAFSGVKRAYPVQTSTVLWPTAGGAPWPHAPLDTNAYAALEPPGGWPRISIVTPSFNQAEYVEETLLSVLNQGYPNLQFIVVDGASTDGTREILERYRDRVDHLIIESDNGQTEAINKGLRLADGELLGWLNSDDMFAPGALHVMAAAWRSTDADLLSGLCLEHSDRHVLLVNRPRGASERFTPEALAEIFRYWLKGDYFYQPEVLFTRRALDLAGGELDESLFYTMDYDLWMKMALAGCRVELVNWPVALFRKHPLQKTTKLVDCIEEQSQVRTKHRPLAPPTRRLREVAGRFRSFGGKGRPSVAVVSSRRQKIFSNDVAKELAAAFASADDVCFAETAEDPRVLEADIVFYLVHLQNDVDQIAALRAARQDRPVVGWFWDNHHHPFQNHEVAEVLDVATPGHAAYAEYLRTASSLLDPHLPLCVTQWSRRQVEAWFPEFGRSPRSSALYGGFVRYPFAEARNAFLESCVRELPEHELFLLKEGDLGPYFGKSEKARFAEWCRFKTSLVVPLHNDLSQRFFDALLAGQIPLVPQELTGFDEIVSPELQRELPVMKYSLKDWRTVAGAHAEAVQAFDRDGLAGAERRHAFAAENHMFESRIRTLLDRARARAQADAAQLVAS